MQTLTHYMDALRARHPHFPELHQAVEEIARSVWPLLHDHPRWRQERVFDRLVEPDRIVSFRVVWTDDAGAVHVERGFRVQQSNLLGPYKGGLRFRPEVGESMLRFLAFEQAFKDALTGLPLGGAKGGATFDPRGRSEAEVMRFCQAFMAELGRHIGASLDVPAGDQGVGAREVGFLYGAYRRAHGLEQGVLTGKPLDVGGIPMRTQATGHGLVYFLREALRARDEDLATRRCLISGAGNVALHAAEKLIDLGAKVVTLSDSGGALVCPGGLERECLGLVKRVKASGGALADAADEVGGEHRPGEKPWAVAGDLALPCATENELDARDAERLAEAGVRAVAEGANMPCTAQAIATLKERGVLHLPGKAANAGGVAVSGLEMAQNAQREPWSAEAVDARLQEVMARIHAACLAHAPDRDDYDAGANRAAFARLARAMIGQGVP